MSEPFIRPDVLAFLDMMAASPRPAMSRELIAMIRTMPVGSIPSLDLPVGDVAEVRTITMPSPGGNIALRLFDPREAPVPSPVVVFYHGGGFAVGSVETHSGLAAEMARDLGLPVVSVEYRLAPENPWPAAPDDAEAAARWIALNGDAFGREFTGLVLAGDSAGGNLAAVTALALRDAPAAVPVVLQLAIYPVTDSNVKHPSRTALGEGYFLTTSEITLFDELYASDPAHWRASPLLADLSGLAPTVVITASLDPLRDEGRAYAAKLAESGVRVEHYEADGSIHGFCTYRLHIPSARDDLAKSLALAKAMLAETTR